MKFKEYVRYKQEEWLILSGFMSGNGTQDSFLLKIKNVTTGEVLTVSESEVTYISPF